MAPHLSSSMDDSVANHGTVKEVPMTGDERADGGWTRRTLLVAAATGGAALAGGFALPPSPALAMARPNDPITGRRFTITVDGVEIATFSEFRGITTEIDTNDVLPPRRRSSLVLRRRYTSDNSLQDWQELAFGDSQQGFKNGALIMFDDEGKPTTRYWLEKAWPSKVELANLKAGASEELLETVTVTCEFIQRVAP